MTNLDGALTQLIQERDRLNQAIAALEHVTSNGNISQPNRRRGISAAGRLRIAAAQRARWAKARGTKLVSIATKSSGNKRKMSAAARMKIVAAQKARWAKWRKANKK